MFFSKAVGSADLIELQRQRALLVRCVVLVDQTLAGCLLYTSHQVSSGGEGKIVIQEGQVCVNGETCTMRGKKLYPGDVVSYQGHETAVARQA